MQSKLIQSVTAIIIYFWWHAVFNLASALILGKVAGDQFEASDKAYVQFSLLNSALSSFNVTTVMLIVVLLLIWRTELKKLLKAITTVLTLLLCMCVYDVEQADAFAEKTDRTEAYTILPNESAFWIPDVGDNKTSAV